MALYVIHEDVIKKSKILKETCSDSSVQAVAAEITKMLILLKDNNTFWSITSNRKALIKQGKTAINNLNAIKVTENNVQDVMKLRNFFAEVASMFGSGLEQYNETIFEQETFTVLTKTANLKEISQSFQAGLETKIDQYQREQNLKFSNDETSIEEKIIIPMPLARPLITNLTNEKLKVETLPLQNKVSTQPEEIEYYYSPKTKKSKMVTDKIKNKALGVFGSLGDIISNKNNNEEIATERKTKSSSLSSRSRDSLTQIVPKKPGSSKRKKNSLARVSTSDSSLSSSSTENSQSNDTMQSESSSKEKVSLSLPPLTVAPLNSVSKNESSQIQQMREIKEDLIILKQLGNKQVIETLSAQISDNNINEVLENDNKVSFKENSKLGFFANQSKEDSPKLDNQPVHEAKKSSSSSENEYSLLEFCILAGLSLTIVGLLVVIPYVIYKSCCSTPNVEEPEQYGLSM
jgi:hypothetical protein